MSKKMKLQNNRRSKKAEVTTNAVNTILINTAVAHGNKIFGDKQLQAKFKSKDPLRTREQSMDEIIARTSDSLKIPDDKIVYMLLFLVITEYRKSLEKEAKKKKGDASYA